MAPEQARGQPIDQRVDVYAFGLILYDALLGQRRASSGAAAVEELQRRMSAQPPPLQALSPEIPAPLAALVARCVEPDADKRFQTSAEVAAELSRLDDHGKLIPIARRLTGRMVATAALLVATLVGAAVYVTRQATQPAVQHEPVSVIIADVENPTKNAAFEGTLEPMIKLALEETGFVTAFDRTQLRALGVGAVKGPFDEAAARAAALNQGRGVVVTASIGPDGRGFAFVLKAVEAVTGNIITTTQERFGRPEEVLQALSRASTTLREALGDEVSESARRFAMETLSATSLDAVAQYARAMDALSNGDQLAAKAAALQATAIDENFGSAYGVAAIASRNMNELQDAATYIQQASDHLASMTQRERLRTRGFAAELRGNYQQCAEEYGELIARYYADASARNNRAVCLTQLRQMRQALDEIRQAAGILPKRALYRVNTALFAAYGSDFPASERAAGEALALNPAFTQGIIARAFAQLGQGRVADAAATYRELEKVSPSDAASGFADLAMYEGRFAEAIRLLNAGIQADLQAKSVDRAADKLVALGYAELMRGDRRAVIAAAEQALEHSRSPKIRLLAGRLFSEAGDLDRADLQAKELGKALPVLSQVYGKIIEGNIALQRGDAKDAVQILGEANTKLLDTWLGRFDLGRAYLAADAFAEADGQFDRCLTRPGEAMSLALDEAPTFAYFPQVYYYMGRARQGQGITSFAESYRAYLNIRAAANEDRLLDDIRRRMQQP
jgi:tetratricopeptide (TPR) repeat protein